MSHQGLNLSRLRWVAVLAPLLFLGALELMRQVVIPSAFVGWFGSALLLLLIALAVFLFSTGVFGVLSNMQRQLLKQNEHLASLELNAQEKARHLRALHESSLVLTSDLSLEHILQRVVDLARELVDARYGAVAVVDEEGRWQEFVTSGLSPNERKLIGDPPKGRGVFGLVYRERRSLRLPDAMAHPSFSGFPPHHPPMRSFLGVPAIYQGKVLGLLYLTEKQGAPEFSETDEETANLFVAQAAVAMKNAVLHAQVQQLAVEEERRRIAREMHDGLAQVLAYVNVKTGAVRRLLQLDRRTEAARELEGLEEAAREVYADVREGILGLSVITQDGEGFLAALHRYVERFSQQAEMPVAFSVELREEELASLGQASEVQLIRVVQEALSNVRKHASARAAQVHFSRRNDGLLLTITDDGRGFDPGSLSRSESPRFGLQTMRERVESLGGSFLIQSAPGQGTTVRVQVPFSSAR